MAIFDNFCNLILLDLSTQMLHCACIPCIWIFKSCT